MLKTIRIGRDICWEARYYSVLTLSFHTALLFGPLPYNLAINTAQNLHFLIYLLYNFCNFTTELSWVNKGYWREPRFYTFSTQFFLESPSFFTVYFAHFIIYRQFFTITPLRNYTFSQFEYTVQYCSSHLPTCRNDYFSRGPSPSPPGRELGLRLRMQVTWIWK